MRHLLVLRSMCHYTPNVEGGHPACIVDEGPPRKRRRSCRRVAVETVLVPVADALRITSRLKGVDGVRFSRIEELGTRAIDRLPG
jgi:hypothetical protein